MLMKKRTYLKYILGLYILAITINDLLPYYCQEINSTPVKYLWFGFKVLHVTNHILKIKRIFTLKEIFKAKKK